MYYSKNHQNHVAIFYCTVIATNHPKKHHGVDSPEFIKSTLEVGTNFDHWLPYTGTIQDIARLSTEGHTVIPADFDGDRKQYPDDNPTGKGFLSSQVVYLDLDGIDDIERVLKLLNDANHPANFYYKTYTYTEDCKKYRVAIAFDEPITDLTTYLQIIDYLIDLIGSDASCKDSLRLYYPGTDLQFLTDEPTSTKHLVECAKSFANDKNNRIEAANKTELKMLNSEALLKLIDYASNLKPEHPWRRMVCDREWLYHNDLYPIATSLRCIDGGREYFEEYLERQPYKKKDLRDKRGLIPYIVKRNLKPTGFNYNNQFNKNDINSWSLYHLALALINESVASHDKRRNLVQEEVVSEREKSSEASQILESSNPSQSKDYSEDIQKLAPSTYIYSIRDKGQKLHIPDDVSVSRISQPLDLEELNKDEGHLSSTNIPSPILASQQEVNSVEVKARMTDSKGDELYKCEPSEDTIKRINTKKEARVDILLKDPIFYDWYHGIRELDTDDTTYPELKYIFWGLGNFKYIVLKDGKSVRTEKFLNDVTSRQSFYAKKKRSNKAAIADTLIKGLKKYREENLAKYGKSIVLPCWLEVDEENRTLYQFHNQQLEQKPLPDSPDKNIIEDKSSEYEYATLEENRAWLNAPERRLNQLKRGLFNIILGCAGLGKTDWLINQIKIAIADGTFNRIVKAVLNHKLKDETKERWIKAGIKYGIDFICTPDINDLPKDILEVIMPLIASGLHGDAKEVLQKKFSHRPEVQEYLANESKALNFQGIILTTHSKCILRLVTNDKGEFGFPGKDTYIFDEDISNELLTEESIKYSDIVNVLTHLQSYRDLASYDIDGEEFDAIADGEHPFDATLANLDYLLKEMRRLKKEYVDEEVRLKLERGANKKPTKVFDKKLEFGDINRKVVYKAVRDIRETMKLDTKVLAAIQSDIVTYSGNGDYFEFGRRVDIELPDNFTYICTTATPNLLVYEKLFGEKVELHQAKLTKYKAALFRVNTTQTSKTKMKDGNKLSQKWQIIVQGIPSEVAFIMKCFKQEAERLNTQITWLHYPGVGFNKIQGLSMVLIGKYLCAESALVMKALLLGFDVESTKRQNQIIETRDGIKHKTYTFTNPILKQLDEYYYSSAIKQSIGRLRPLSYASTIYFFSDRAVEQERRITVKKYNKSVHISHTNDDEKTTISMNYVFNDIDEKHLFEDKLFGLRNEDGTLTEFGKKKLAEFNGDRQAVLKSLLLDEGNTEQVKEKYQKDRDDFNESIDRIES